MLQNVKEGRSRCKLGVGLYQWLSETLYQLYEPYFTLCAAREGAELIVQEFVKYFRPSHSSFAFPPSRTSTSCATGQRWSTWEALTTMQHNHSHQAAPPTGQTNPSGACQVSHLSHHPLTWLPFQTRPCPPLRPPLQLPERGGCGGVGRGNKKKKIKGHARFLPRQRAKNQSQRSTLTHLMTHMRFCFKNEMKTSREQDSNPDKHDNRCTDAMAQSGSSASLLRPSQTSPFVKGYW